MIEKISRWILYRVSTEWDSEDKKAVLLFGITRIVEDITKFIGIIIICSLLGILKELGFVFCILFIYKTNVGGVHCKTNIGCFISTLLFFLVCIYGSEYIIFKGLLKIWIYISLYIFGLYVIWVYVPADVPEIPIISKKIRKRTKVVSLVLINILYIVAIVFIEDIKYQNMIIYTMFYINLMATRIIYRLFKNEYGYENYIPDELLIKD